MCGIVGYVGDAEARKIVMDGLRRLEYRGYDSCGIALKVGDAIDFRRVVGGLDRLEQDVQDLAPSHLAIGHTRWATHGAATAQNAHPHTDCKGRLAIVHNGVIENFHQLKSALGKKHTFRSETDTEVLAHLIESHYDGDLLAATEAALREVRGTFAILVHHEDDEAGLVFARRGAPLIVGLAKGGHAVASDPTALLGLTKDVIYLQDDDVGRATRGKLIIRTLRGGAVKRPTSHIQWTPEQAEKGGFDHYMLKEMYEVPRAVRDTTTGRLSITPPHINFETLPPKEARASVPRVRLLAAGTSFHAALIGKNLIETLAKIPCEVTLASEYRASPHVEERGTLAVAITQSGETADTLGAVREAKRRGLSTLAITNVEGSTAAREADQTVFTRAGPEIGVAATKTYAAQLAAITMLAIDLGEAKRRGEPRELRAAANHLKQVPYALDGVLEAREALQAIAKKYHRASSVFFLGRGANHASAQEGALKLKEIAYAHAEGYSAGELKHGPFALLTKKTPVIFLLPRDGLEEKMIGTILEVRSRGSPVIGLAIGDATPWRDFCHDVVRLPEVDAVVAPLIFGLATHLFSYEVARLRDCPIDRPRNLAKSVTVE